MTNDQLAAKAQAKAAGKALAAASNAWALMVVVGAASVGLVVIAAAHWRRGSFIIGASMLLGALLRLVLPEKAAGLLAVRSRWFDVTLMVLFGAAILAATLIVPPSRGR